MYKKISESVAPSNLRGDPRTSGSAALGDRQPAPAKPAVSLATWMGKAVGAEAHGSYSIFLIGGSAVVLLGSIAFALWLVR